MSSANSFNLSFGKMVTSINFFPFPTVFSKVFFIHSHQRVCIGLTFILEALVAHRLEI